MLEPFKSHRIGLPRREFINGDVHYAGPFVRQGVPVTLCGLTGMERSRLNRSPLTCRACDQLARFVWSHAKPHGFRKQAPKP